MFPSVRLVYCIIKGGDEVWVKYNYLQHRENGMAFRMVLHIIIFSVSVALQMFYL